MAGRRLGALEGATSSLPMHPCPPWQREPTGNTPESIFKKVVLPLAGGPSSAVMVPGRNSNSVAFNTHFHLQRMGADEGHSARAKCQGNTNNDRRCQVTCPKATEPTQKKTSFFLCPAPPQQHRLWPKLLSPIVCCGTRAGLPMIRTPDSTDRHTSLGFTRKPRAFAGGAGGRPAKCGTGRFGAALEKPKTEKGVTYPFVA